MAVRTDKKSARWFERGRRTRSEGGFTLIEVVVASLLIGIGLLAVLASLDSFRTLASTASAKEEGTQVVEREIERLRGLGWNGLVLTGNPGTSSNPVDPRFGVTAGASPNYRPSANAALEPLSFDAATGQVTHQATAWSTDTASGSLYRFVTVQNCGEPSGCPKRITVAATFGSRDDPKRPIVASSVVTDPDLIDGAGNPNYASGAPPNATTNKYYAYDTAVGDPFRSPPYTDARLNQAASHATHKTAPVTGQSQYPDLLAGIPASNAAQGPFNYSTDVPGTYPLGGAAVRRSGTNCNGNMPSSPPSGANAQQYAHWWVTPKYPVATTVTGNAAMSFYTQTVGATAGFAKLCVAAYEITLDNTGKVTATSPLPSSATPVVSSFSLSNWPTLPDPVTFSFRFLDAGTTRSIAANKRIGFRVTVDASSVADVALLYDHPTFLSYFEVESQ